MANGIGRVGWRNYVSPIPQVSTLINGLVGYWNANGSANDSIGTNNGTLTNGASANGTAKLGSNSFSFDGVNDYVAMSSATAWNFTTDFSVGFWVKANNVTSQQMLVNNFQYQGGSFKGWDIRISSGSKVVVTIWGTGGGLTYLSNTSLTISTWTYVEVVYKRGVSVEFRLNGSSDVTRATTELPLYPTNTTPCFGLLVYALGTGYAFNGLMDSISLWNRATTLTESTELYGLTTELQAPTPTIITSGLVMNLDASNTLSYAGTGTTWTDLSGNGKNGILVNGPTYNSANGGYLQFDGINDYVNITVKPQQNAMTLEVWVKLVTVTSGVQQYFMVDSGAGYVELGMVGDKAYFGVAGSPYSSAIGLTSRSVGTWYQIVGRYKNGEKASIYVNGVLDKQGTNTNTTIGSVATDFQIFRNGGTHLNGSMAVSRIYNTALSDADILNNFNAVKSRYGY